MFSTSSVLPLRLYRCMPALWLCVIGVAAPLPVAAATQVLYDAQTAPGNPKAAGWLDSGFFLLQETVTGRGAQVAPVSPNVFGNAGAGGYSNRTSAAPYALVNAAFPDLDRQAGYSLDLGFFVTGENHSGNNNRAGFSITLIGNDLMGIEIGFQGTSIFAQGASPLFAAADSTSVPSAVGTLADYARWQVRVRGSSYELVQAGSTVLTGALRNYSAYSGLGEEAYHTPNFLFFGDNTSSASATFGVDYAAITTAVPEPASYGMLLAGMLLVGTAVRRRRQ